MARKLKVGIIGMGTIGPIHADAYANCSQAELVGICDILPEKLARHGDKFGVKNRYEDYRDLLASDIDAVSVCVGNWLHREIAIAALAAGKNVLLEKPMAVTARQAADIAQAARKAKGILQIGMVNRQKADAQLLRRMIEQGQLGEIYHMRAVLIRRRGIPGMGGWFTTKARSGGGPIIDIGVHWFDLCMFLSGHWKPTSVLARTYAKFGAKMRDYKYVSMWAGPPDFGGTCDTEDYAAGFVQFGPRATMSFEIAWAANAQQDSYVDILGDKGGARLFGEKPLQLFTQHAGELANIEPQINRDENAFHVQARKFLSACQGQCPPAATAEQGVTNMKLIDAIYQSSAKNKEIKIR